MRNIEYLLYYLIGPISLVLLVLVIMRVNKLNKEGRKSKLPAIIFSFSVVFNLVITTIVFVYFVKRAINPNEYNSYLYPVSPGNDALNFSIVLGIIMLIYLAVIITLIVKRKFYIPVSVSSTSFLFMFSIIGFLITALLANGKMYSFTDDLNNFGVYDREIMDEIELIPNNLPDKSEIIRYEYTFTRGRGFLRGHYLTIYIETNYKTIDLVDFEEFEAYNDELDNFDIYVSKSNGNLYLLIRKDNMKMYYAVSNYSHYIVFNENATYGIADFINNR